MQWAVRAIGRGAGGDRCDLLCVSRCCWAASSSSIQGYEFANQRLRADCRRIRVDLLHPDRLPRGPRAGRPGASSAIVATRARQRAHLGRAPHRGRGGQLLLALRRRGVAGPLLDAVRPVAPGRAARAEARRGRRSARRGRPSPRTWRDLAMRRPRRRRRARSGDPIPRPPAPAAGGRVTSSSGCVRPSFTCSTVRLDVDEVHASDVVRQRPA